MTIRTIRPAVLQELCKSGQCVELIDVRTPAEFQSLHADIASNRPLDALRPQEIISQRNGSAQHPLYVICRSGSRAEMACKKFIDAGFDNVLSVEGGTEAWASAGLPVVRGKRSVIAIDRQMRILAGTLVVLGVFASYFQPVFVGLSAFVGCGLIFAGVTNICPMMNMLARMPWNQASKCGKCS